MENKRLSLADLKLKASKAFIDAEAIKGGLTDSCHVQLPPIKIEPIRCDNI